MIQPEFLAKGDLVGIVSASKKTEPHEIEFGLKLLQSWGLDVVLGEHIFAEDYFFAGTPEQRTSDLQKMLDNPQIKAIFFTKGGYGLLQIIDTFNFSGFKKHPKWVVGYSDVTVLHSHLNTLGYQTLHSVMLQGMNTASPESITSVYDALFGKKIRYTIPKNPKNKNISNKISGELVGGNLSILYALIGSESALKMDNKLLFIEDIDEYKYHLDRMLLGLDRSGCFKNLKALLIGAMIDIKDATLPYGKTYEEIILERTKNYHFPVVFDAPVGHQPENKALVLGNTYTISINKDVVVEIL